VCLYPVFFSLSLVSLPHSYFHHRPLICSICTISYDCINVRTRAGQEEEQPERIAHDGAPERDGSGRPGMPPETRLPEPRPSSAPRCVRGLGGSGVGTQDFRVPIPFPHVATSGQKGTSNPAPAPAKQRVGGYRPIANPSRTPRAETLTLWPTVAAERPCPHQPAEPRATPVIRSGWCASSFDRRI
jgi:hypothetical protein